MSINREIDKEDVVPIYNRILLSHKKIMSFAETRMDLETVLQSEVKSDQFSSVQPLSHVRLFATPWIAARQASLSITNSRSLLKLMSIEMVMPSSHLIFCHPLLRLPPIPPSIRIFSHESTLRVRWPKYGSFSNRGKQVSYIKYICGI